MSNSLILCPARRRIFLLDDYSANLGDDVKEALYNKGYLLRIIPEAIADNVQGNDTDFQHLLRRVIEHWK